MHHPPSTRRRHNVGHEIIDVNRKSNGCTSNTVDKNGNDHDFTDVEARIDGTLDCGGGISMNTVGGGHSVPEKRRKRRRRQKQALISSKAVSFCLEQCCCCGQHEGSRQQPQSSTDHHHLTRRRNHRLRIALGSLVLLLLCSAYIYFMLGARVPVNQHPAHPPMRPIPYPPSHIQVTVVLMNYARPRMLQSSSLLSTLVGHPSVSTILLCHAQASTAFVYNHTKVVNIDAVATNAQWGLALRFYFCSTVATTDWVLHVDDDMELDDSAINDLIMHMVQNPHRIVGHYARQYNYWKVPHRHGYDFATTLSGPVEVVLTKILVLERAVCTQFVNVAHVMDDLVQTSTPHWNGEDIMINLVANRYYQSSIHGAPNGNRPNNAVYNNYAIAKLNVWEADNRFKDDDSGDHDLSSNMDRHYHAFASWHGWTDYWKAWWKSLQHYHYRGRLWATAKQRLAKIVLK